MESSYIDLYYNDAHCLLESLKLFKKNNELISDQTSSFLFAFDQYHLLTCLKFYLFKRMK